MNYSGTLCGVTIMNANEMVNLLHQTALLLDYVVIIACCTYNMIWVHLFCGTTQL